MVGFPLPALHRTQPVERHSRAGNAAADTSSSPQDMMAKGARHFYHRLGSARIAMDNHFCSCASPVVEPKSDRMTFAAHV